MSYIIATWILAPIWWPVSIIRKLLTPQPQRILIVEIAGIGDVVCSTNLFMQLRGRYPDAQIDLVIDPIVISLAPLLSMIDNIIPFSYAKQKGLLGRFRLLALCARYDTGISLNPSAAQLTGFCLAGMPRRLSVLPGPLNNSYRFLKPLLTSSATHMPGQFFIKTQAQLLTQLGLVGIEVGKWLPRSPRSNQAIECDSKAIQIGVLVSSGRELKRLDSERMAEIISGLLALKGERHIEIVLVGGPGDLAMAQSILSFIDDQTVSKIRNTVGTYKLNELTALLAQLSLFVGVDSGVTHMADAIGVPLVCIAGPVDLNEVYEPNGKRVLLGNTIACQPCSWVFDTPSTCRLHHRNCLEQLKPDDIVNAASHLLDQKND